VDVDLLVRVRLDGEADLVALVELELGHAALGGAVLDHDRRDLRLLGLLVLGRLLRRRVVGGRRGRDGRVGVAA
jgi:hypothetical protein